MSTSKRMLRRVRWRVVLVLLAGLLIGAATQSVGQSGKLSGRVIDADTGEPIPGATVLVTGQEGLGTATDVDGRYAVLRVPPGTHTIRFSSVGFQTKLVEGVRVSSNKTTELNAELSEEVIQGEEVTVTAERPLVDVSQTSSMATLTSEEIDVLPVQSLQDVVELQAGVVDGHFRGGRSGEVQYQVDGVSVNNPYNNESTLRLDRSVLQEVQVIQGTFDAEYGQAMSGVVNAVLRDGSPDRYQFSFETFFGDYVSTNDDPAIVPSRNDPAVMDTFPRFPHIDDYDPLVLQNYQASLSGPVPLVPKTTFLLNGQRLVDEGHLYGRRVFMPTDSADLEQRVVQPSGDGAWVPMAYSREWSFLGKLSHTSIPSVRLEYQAIGNVIERTGYQHAFRLNPEGIATQKDVSLVHGFDVTHTLSDRTYYTVSARQNYHDFEDLKYDDLEDPRYFEAGLPEAVADFEDGAFVQGVDFGRFVQSTNMLVVKTEMTSQVTREHLLKGGVEVQVADLQFGAPGLLVEKTLDGVTQLVPETDTVGAVVNEYQPVFGSTFIQDRIEWSDLRIRAGVRLEYFDANATLPSDLANPANSIEGAPPSPPKETSVKLAVAPRLGVSFPILDRASMYFSYGHFYQMPALGQMFSNADYSVLEDLQAGGISYGVLGNPDLDPQFTAQYEFGFKSELNRYLGLDVSLFFKDIRDLLGVEFVQTYTAAEYARLTNVDFGKVRGVTVSLDQRSEGGLSTSIDYTLQLAIGNASDPQETAIRAEAGEDPRPRQIPFNWDQRHTLNTVITYFRPDNFSVTGIVKLSGGQPYTPSTGSVFGADLETNSGRKPAFVIADLRAEKFFHLFGLNVTGFARVLNLFDQHFANGFVFPQTGSPFYAARPSSQRATLRDPSRFHEPRRVQIGISLNGAFSR